MAAAGIVRDSSVDAGGLKLAVHPDGASRGASDGQRAARLRQKKQRRALAWSRARQCGGISELMAVEHGRIGAGASFPVATPS